MERERREGGKNGYKALEAKKKKKKEEEKKGSKQKQRTMQSRDTALSSTCQTRAEQRAAISFLRPPPPFAYNIRRGRSLYSAAYGDVDSGLSLARIRSGRPTRTHAMPSLDATQETGGERARSASQPACEPAGRPSREHLGSSASSFFRPSLVSLSSLSSPSSPSLSLSVSLLLLPAQRCRLAFPLMARELCLTWGQIPGPVFATSPASFI